MVGKSIAIALPLLAAVVTYQGCGRGDEGGGQFVRVWIDEPPTLAPIDSTHVLAYELHFTSESSIVPTIQRIEVLSADRSRRTLLVLSDSDLASVLQGVGDTTDFLNVEQGPRVVAYMWVPVDSTFAPKAIRHRIRIVDKSGTEHVVDVKPTPIRTEYASITAPVRGSHWLVGDGPSNESRHRRYLFAHSGRIILWERFAIDFQLVDSAGRNMRTDGMQNADHYSYDQPVFAVAGGRVIGVRSDLPDNTPSKPPVVAPDLDTVSGNYVILDIGGGRYVLYAHLRPSSVTVKTGDIVQRGRELGRIGNTGLSTGPHLHFQVSDRPGIYSGEGLPFAFERYQVIGECTDDTTCIRRPAILQRRVLPRSGQLLRFDR